MVAFKSRFWAALDFPRLADWPDGDGVGPSSVRTDAPCAKLWDETEADDGATSSACAETAPKDAAPMPMSPASEAAASRSDLARGADAERPAEADRGATEG